MSPGSLSKQTKWPISKDCITLSCTSSSCPYLTHSNLAYCVGSLFLGKLLMFQGFSMSFYGSGLIVLGEISLPQLRDMTTISSCIGFCT